MDRPAAPPSCVPIGSFDNGPSSPFTEATRMTGDSRSQQRPSALPADPGAEQGKPASRGLLVAAVLLVVAGVACWRVAFALHSDAWLTNALLCYLGAAVTSGVWVLLSRRPGALLGWAVLAFVGCFAVLCSNSV